jgi:hypothetical protein
MANPDAFRLASAGGFVRLTLRGGPTVSGYGAADPDDPSYLRFDTLAPEDDGTLSQISLRLRAGDIDAIQPLAAAPVFPGPEGSVVVLSAALWPGNSNG